MSSYQIFEDLGAGESAKRELKSVAFLNISSTYQEKHIRTKYEGFIIWIYDFHCLSLDGIRLQLVYRSRVPLLVVLMEVEGGVPQGGVHVDVLLHRLQHRVGGGVPVQVPEERSWPGTMMAWKYLSSLLILASSSTASVTTASNLIASNSNHLKTLILFTYLMGVVAGGGWGAQLIYISTFSYSRENIRIGTSWMYFLATLQDLYCVSFLTILV